MAKTVERIASKVVDLLNCLLFLCGASENIAALPQILNVLPPAERAGLFSRPTQELYVKVEYMTHRY